MKLLKVIAISLSLFWASAQAQNISIATGGTGGVYYPRNLRWNDSRTRSDVRSILGCAECLPSLLNC